MERIRNFFRNILAWFRHDQGRHPVVIQREQGADNNQRRARPNRPGFNAAAHAFDRIFTPRHASEERVIYRPVTREGVVVQQTEEFFREGNTGHARFSKTMVVTCSGEIVSAERLQGICWCGGYDDAIARCAWCGRALCRLHKRIFPSESGQLVLCDTHYRQAVDQINTWKIVDRNRQREKQ